MPIAESTALGAIKKQKEVCVEESEKRLLADSRNSINADSSGSGSARNSQLLHMAIPSRSATNSRIGVRRMTEREVQIRLAEMLAVKYPTIIFHSDYGSGLKMTKGQAVVQKRMNGGKRAFPDLQICEPRRGKHGMFLEIKKDGVRIRKKNGELVANQHIREQARMLERLRDRGYEAEFGIGIDDCLNKIQKYLD